MVLAPRTSALPKLFLKPGRWTVGSAATCSYRIAGDGVRPRHALVMCGGQNTVLKAWDLRTWHNGQPVRGEVRLQQGDCVTIGSVEFSIESEDVIDATATRLDTPQETSPASMEAIVTESPSSSSPAHPLSDGIMETLPESDDLQQLREELRELRDELSQRAKRRTSAVAIVTTPIAHDEQAIEQRVEQAVQIAVQQAVEQSSARAAEWEQSATEARKLAEQAQQELSGLIRERDQLRSETNQREQAWERQTTEWTTEREQWQERLALQTSTRQQLTADLEERQSALLDEAMRWQTECELLRAESQQQQTTWTDERSRMRDDLQRHANDVQQALQAATQREQELFELSQQRIVEHQQVEAERQQFEATRQQLEVDRQLVETARLSFESGRQQIEIESQQIEVERQQVVTGRQELDAARLDLEAKFKQIEAERQQVVDARPEAEAIRLRVEADRQQFEVDRQQFEADRQQFEADRQQVDADRQQVEADRQQVDADRQQVDADRQQVDADRQQVDAARRQLQAEQAERDSAVAALSEERLCVDQQAAEISAKVEELLRRTTEAEQQQASIAREQQTLEHSWNWLHADRRKIVEEKEEWQKQRAQWQAQQEQWTNDREQLQRDREEFAKSCDHWHEQWAAEQQATTQKLAADIEKLAAERHQLQGEQSVWATNRERFDAELQASAEELEAIRTELGAQKQALSDERNQLEILRANLEARAVAFEAERLALAETANFAPVTNETRTWDDETSSWSSAPQVPADVDHNWKVDATSDARTWSPEQSPNSFPSPSLETSTNDWSIGVDLTAPRETPASEQDEDAEIASKPTQSDQGNLYDEVTSVRDLDLPKTTLMASAWDIALGPADPNNFVRSERSDTSLSSTADAYEAETAESSVTSQGHTQTSDRDDAAQRELMAASEASTPSQNLYEPDATLASEDHGNRDTEASIVPAKSPTAGILESMAFSDDEDVDDSVSRYMQHLLARSPQSATSEDGGRDRYVAVPTSKKSDISEAALGKSVSTTTAANGDVSLKPDNSLGNQAEASQRNLEQPVLFSLAHSMQPVHVQDKNAIRAATEQMRHVANQQTVTNVEAANWKQIKQSIKMKLVLAALAFLLSAGLLYFGYYYRHEFMILGICSSGLGILTWLDLILAIRQAQTRASNLTGRKKPVGPENS